MAWPKNYKPETIERLRKQRAENQASRREATKQRTRERIANYRAKGWDDLVETETELFIEHYGEQP